MNIKIKSSALVITCMIICAFIACADSIGNQKDDFFTDCWNAPDSTARVIMGNRLSELLLKPKKVEMYTVVYRDSTNKSNVIVEHDFVLDSMICKLSKEQIAVLDYILVSDETNFKVDSLAIPMIPHRPAYAFNFKGKKDNAIVWYSPGDYTWGIRYDGRNIFWYNVAHPSYLNKFCLRLKKNK